MLVKQIYSIDCILQNENNMKKIQYNISTKRFSIIIIVNVINLGAITIHA